MDTTAKSDKPSYQATLEERAAQVYNQCLGAPDAEARQKVLLEALKATALESWKNGLEAGRRRAQTTKSPRATVAA